MRKVLALLSAISVALVLTFLLIAPGKQSLRQTAKSAQVQNSNYQVWSNISPQVFTAPSCSSSSSSQPWQQDFWRLYANQHIQHGVPFPAQHSWLNNWYPQHSNVIDLGVRHINHVGGHNLGGAVLGGQNWYGNLGYGFPQGYVPHGYFGGEVEGPELEEGGFLLNQPGLNVAPHHANIANVAQSAVSHSSGASVVGAPRVSGIQGLNYGVHGLNYGVQGWPSVPLLGEYEPEFPENEWRWGALYNNWASSLSGCGGRNQNVRLAKVGGQPIEFKN